MPEPRITVLTDSSSQLTDVLAERHGVEVVPVTISLDGVDYQEGVDLDADRFYSLLRSDSELSTAQPAPGLFVDAVERAAEAGAEMVLAVLVGSQYSGTVSSANVAAGLTSIPLHVLDTGTASFGVSCCVLAASAAIEAGADLDAARLAALDMAETVESVFVLQGLELARRSGRFHQVDLGRESPLVRSDGSNSVAGSDAGLPIGEERDGIMVLWAGAGKLEVVDTVFTIEEAATAMAKRVGEYELPMRVASSLAGPPMAPLSETLDQLLAENPLVRDVIHYRVGPSVAAQTGPGTAGVFYFPAN